jgi:sporulation protein YlmC with PRC-barrel domain
LERVRTSTLIGKTVCDKSGKILGAVGDVELSGNTVYLIVRMNSQSSPAQNTSEFSVRWDQVASVQDIILLKIKHEAAAPQTEVCSACGYRNPPVAQFCRKCGKSLA